MSQKSEHPVVLARASLPGIVDQARFFALFHHTNMKNAATINKTGVAARKRTSTGTSPITPSSC